MSWPKQRKSPIVIYTDGSCLKNPGGPGGWAALILYTGGKITELSGHVPSTTNNRMEMLAAIEALKALEDGSLVLLHTDSQYVKKGISQWVHGWVRRNWKTAENKPVVNQDLWQEMIFQQSRHTVNWLWVKGHGENQHNNRCDELAGLAARNKAQILDLTLDKTTA